MKKNIIILTSLLFFFQFNVSFAEGTCPVKSGPSKGLTEYFQDMQSILSAVQSEIGKAKGCGEKGTGIFDNVTGNAKKGYNTIVGDVNKVINFDGFLSSWEFNLYPIFNGKVPQEFYRDHDYMANRTEKINKITTTASKKCALNNQLKVSDDIKTKITKYEIDPSTISSTLSGLRKLNDEATAFFRCTVAGSMGGCALSSNVLKEDISNNYGSDAREVCNKADTSFDKMMDQIKKITNMPSGFTALQAGIDEWKAAIKLLGQALGGTNDPAYYKKEKELLAKELQKQGIKGTQAAAMLSNLGCMNDEKKTLSECVKSGVKSMVQPFIDVYKNITNQMVANSSDTKSIARQSYSLKSQEYIVEDIKNDYENIKTLMLGENKSQEKGLATLIQLHQNLNATNKMLEEHIKLTQQLCNMQGSGDGVCK